MWFTQTRIVAVMAGTALVGLGYYAKTTLGRRAPGCRIICKFTDPLMEGYWSPVTEFEFEDTPCTMPDDIMPVSTLNTISQLPVDKTDVFVASFVKSGSLQVIFLPVYSFKS